MYCMSSIYQLNRPFVMNEVVLIVYTMKFQCGIKLSNALLSSNRFIFDYGRHNFITFVCAQT